MCHEIECTHHHIPVVLHYWTECLAVAALAAPDRILLVDHVLSWSPAAFIRNIQAIETIGSLHCCGERQLTRVVGKKDMMLFASGWAIPPALYYRTSRGLSPVLGPGISRARQVRIERGGLHDGADAMEHTLMRYTTTKQAEAARCRLHQPEQHVHGRRLARPVWPQKPEDMAPQKSNRVGGQATLPGAGRWLTPLDHFRWLVTGWWSLPRRHG